MIIFDLDGTLIDSAPIILQAYKTVLDDLSVKDYKISKDSVGKNLLSVFLNDYSLSLVDALNATARHRKITKAMFDVLKSTDNIFFSGVVPLIEKLNKLKIKIGIATLKSQEVARNIIMKSSIWNLIDEELILGMDSSEQNKKSEIIDCIISKTNSSRNETLIIGDHSSDYYASISCGVRFLPVSYGYGMKTFEGFKISSPIDIIDYIRKVRL